MKKFTIHYNYYATIDVEVLADSTDEAITKARKINVNPNDYDLTLNEESIIDSIDVPNPSDLMNQTENILKKAEEDVDIILNPWPEATIRLWNGREMEKRTEIMEAVYWDSERDEIGFSTDSWDEATIYDLPEIQQFYLCLAIIKAAEENGIINHQKSNENA